MKIISHRGCWTKVSEKNSREAIIRSFQLGFGTETDIRDYGGKIVISHDIPRGSELDFAELILLYNTFAPGLPLALNIKADGLQTELARYLREYNVTNYFVFDMSIPDTIGYLNNRFRYCVRQSELETIDYHSLLYRNAFGVWLDEFYQHWINSSTLLNHLGNGKTVCIVSPELHGRDYLNEWNHYKEAGKNIKTDKLILCTDLPEYAREFFA